MKKGVRSSRHFSNCREWPILVVLFQHRHRLMSKLHRSDTSHLFGMRLIRFPVNITTIPSSNRSSSPPILPQKIQATSIAECEARYGNYTSCQVAYRDSPCCSDWNRKRHSTIACQRRLPHGSLQPRTQDNDHVKSLSTCFEWHVSILAATDR